MIVMKAIITDLDGVIRDFPSQRNREYEKQYGLPQGTLLHNTFGYPDLNQVIRGEISDDAWRRNIASRIQKYIPTEDCLKIVREWSLFPGIIDYDILNLYTEYRNKGIKLVLLTNATDKLEKDLHTLSIYDRFDLIINSSNIRLIKPDPGIFNYALKKLKIHPLDAVYIDDSSTHSTAASQIGLKAHLFKDFEKLASFLNQNIGKLV